MKGLIFSFQPGPRAGFIRAPWPVRTSAGPLVALRVRTWQSGGQVKGHDRRVPSPHLPRPCCPQLSFWNDHREHCKAGGRGGGGSLRGRDQGEGKKRPRTASGSVVLRAPVSVATGAVLVDPDYNSQGCAGPAGESMRSGRHIVSYQARRG